MWRKVLCLECKFVFWVIWILYYNVSTWENDILKVLINCIRSLSYTYFESVNDRNRHDVLKDGSQVKFMSLSSAGCTVAFGYVCITLAQMGTSSQDHHIASIITLQDTSFISYGKGYGLN
jgi:hypothetical protein